MGVEKKILGFVTITLAAARSAASALTGKVTTRRISASFFPLPAEQARKSFRYLRTTSRKGNLVVALIVSFVLTATGGTKLLTTDPLTGLPLHPATDSRLHLGNKPTQLPESQVCNSKMQVDFYSIYDSKVNATIAWYDAHMPGFKKTHAYAANRSQDTYYTTDGTVLVSVTGSPGKEGENMDTYSVLYARLQPGLAEKTIIALNQQRVVCP